VLVVGPSGAGKDTLLRLARSHFAGSQSVLFPRRLITRGPDAHEDHDSIECDKLHDLVARGQVALNWSAHGLEYAVPSTVDAAISAGAVVVVNVSRAIIPTALAKYAHVVVVFVTAPADVLAERLRQRGRETTSDVAQRLDRAVGDSVPVAPDVVVIQNVGDPQEGADKLIGLIADLASVAAA
jgi:ribose 1,5-bisphosphokinase